MRSFYLGLAATAVLATMSVTASAADEPGAKGAPKSTMRVARDPASGEYKAAPSTSGAKSGSELDAALNESDEGLVEQHHANGMVSVDLQGRYQSTMVAKRGADGKLHITCADAAHGGSPHTHGADGATVPVAADRDDR